MEASPTELKELKSKDQINIELDFLDNLKIVPLSIQWENLTIKADITEKSRNIFKMCNKKVKKDKILLNNLQGYFKEGSLTSILGPSGSGKTTFLNFLSNKLNSTNLSVSGNVTINGTKVTNLSKYSNIFGYVEQDDILFTHFTPFEALQFAAKQRTHLSKQDQLRTINQLLSQFGLNECRDTVIGTKFSSKISKSERKRLSIGIELIANPSLIFLDEPTTGLDSVTAYQILLILKNIAKKGRTVVTTLHQPSSNLFSQFDQLLLLVDGHIIYQGDSCTSLDYFSKIGYPCEKFQNPADYFINIMNAEGLMMAQLKKQIMQNKKAEINKEQVQEEYIKRILYLREKFQESDRFKNEIVTYKYESNSNDSTTVEQLRKEKKLQNYFVETYTLSKRNLQGAKKYMFISIVYQIITAILIMILFQNIGKGRIGAYNRGGLMFLLIMSLNFVGFMDVTLQIFDEINLFIKETQNKTYRTSTYFISKQVGMFVHEVFLVLLFQILVWVGVGLSFNGFFISFLSLYLCYQSSSSMGYLCAASVKSFDNLVTCFALLVVPHLLVCGGSVNSNNIKDYMKWLEYTSIPKFAYQAIVTNIFQKIDKSDLVDHKSCSQFQNAQCDPLKEIDFPENITMSLVSLLIISCGYRCIALYLLNRRSKPMKLKIIS